MRKISYFSYFMILLTILFGFLALNQYNQKTDLNDEITDLKKELKAEKEYTLLYDKTKDFIRLSNEGGHLSLLTGKAERQMEVELENRGTHNHEVGENIVDRTEINNVYAIKTGKDTGESYAIYRVYYNTSTEFETPVSNQRIVSFSLHAEWERVGEEYKVNDYQIQILKDSLDDHIKELLLQERKKENENE